MIFFAEIAKASGITVGKWLVYSPRDTIDDKWAKIAKATVDGKLGTASKVYDICDRLCKNRPCLHLVVIRETLVLKIN